MEKSPPERSVLVVHGKNKKARKAMFEFLRAIDLHPIEWSVARTKTGQGTPYIGAILSAAFEMARAVVVLFTPDDEARLRPEWRSRDDGPHEATLMGQARPNVLFEAGMAMGRNEKNTVLVELGDLRPFSDIGGRHVVRIDNSVQRRQDLAHRLRDAGCPVKVDGTDWHTAGDFESAISAFDIEDAVPSQDTLASSSSRLSKEASKMLRAAVDGDSPILRTQLTDGLHITAGDENFGAPGARAEATWDGALDELEGLGLVKRQSEQVWKVTREGYAWVDQDVEEAAPPRG